MPALNSVTVALAGNPNAGKSTLFNVLTGLHQHTGNWPGKTVEKRVGVCRRNGRTLHIVDLPGTYSLAAYSPEEVIARDYILHERPDMVVDVVDATNLERNLYLAVQLLELEVPVVIALNLADEARRMRLRIDTHRLSELLGGAPVVEVSARHGDGIAELVETILAVAAKYDSGRRSTGEPARPPVATEGVHEVTRIHTK
ncbi:MAG: FeoB small GTPase domain-containing protein [Anaerolineales bacterium]|nr:FeoB small GTPase domain-containing protein [Anaerolineales bacterium]